MLLWQREKKKEKLSLSWSKMTKTYILLSFNMTRHLKLKNKYKKWQKHITKLLKFKLKWKLKI